MTTRLWFKICLPVILASSERLHSLNATASRNRKHSGLSRECSMQARIERPIRLTAVANYVAELFNPSCHIVRASDDQDYFLGMAAAERKIEFKLRTNRREVPPLRHEVVWAWMQGRVDEGIRVKRVKDLAMQNFGLSAETIRRIWLQWGIQKRARRAMAKAGLP